MYKINIFLERKQARTAEKRKTVQTTWLSILSAISILLIIMLMTNATILRERLDALNTEIAELSDRPETQQQTHPQLTLAREMFEIRNNRIDWSPKLAAISEVITPALVLREIHGQTSVKKSPSYFELQGTVSQNESALHQVSEFIEVLAIDPRLQNNFPHIRLDEIRGGSEEFRVICEPLSN